MKTLGPADPPRSLLGSRHLSRPLSRGGVKTCWESGLAQAARSSRPKAFAGVGATAEVDSSVAWSGSHADGELNTVGRGTDGRRTWRRNRVQPQVRPQAPARTSAGSTEPDAVLPCQTSHARSSANPMHRPACRPVLRLAPRKDAVSKCTTLSMRMARESGSGNSLAPSSPRAPVGAVAISAVPSKRLDHASRFTWWAFLGGLHRIRTSQGGCTGFALPTEPYSRALTARAVSRGYASP